MRAKPTRGFTLIELLVVIAIIAILAAILFPVFGRAREAVRQTTCMDNMRKIYVGLKQYHDDNDVYPPLLFAYAQDNLGVPVSTNPVPMGNVARGFLYKKYINDVNVFRCPDNPNKTLTTIVSSPNLSFLPNVGWSGVPRYYTQGFSNFPPNFGNAPISLYAADSYDMTSIPGLNSTRFGLTYLKDWTGTIGRNDKPNQLKYRNPPNDRTVVTWCNYHATVAGANLSPVLLLSGTTKPKPTTELQNRTWLYGDN